VAFVSLLDAVFFVSTAPRILASPRISFIEDEILLAIPLLDEPLPDLVAYNEEVSLNMRSGMILGKTQVDRAANIDRHLI